MTENKEQKNIFTPKENPIWLSVSETAKFGGVTGKTVRRAIEANKIIYKIVKNRYIIDLVSALNFFFSNKKLKNKLNQKGFGQFVDKWRK